MEYQAKIKAAAADQSLGRCALSCRLLLNNGPSEMRVYARVQKAFFVGIKLEHSRRVKAHRAGKYEHRRAERWTALTSPTSQVN
jgi:hypothetical protein